MDILSGIGDDLGCIQLGYQPEELAKMFFEFVRNHPEFHKDIRNFQLQERHCFMQAEERAALGEHRLEWSEAHRRFVELIERLMRAFNEEVACSEQEFAAAIEECKATSSPWWTPFCTLLDTTEYTAFARMLQDNVCLCCGEPFLAYQSAELLQMFLAYMRARPENS